MADGTTVPDFAWCFGHGRLHDWDGRPPWCTSTWAYLSGETTPEALADKAERFGEARFMYELPAARQAEIYEGWSSRHDGPGGAR